MTTKQRLIDALKDIAVNADEDCPSEYRTQDFRDALDNAYTLLQEITNEV